MQATNSSFDLSKTPIKPVTPVLKILLGHVVDPVKTVGGIQGLAIPNESHRLFIAKDRDHRVRIIGNKPTGVSSLGFEESRGVRLHPANDAGGLGKFILGSDTGLVH